MGSDGEKPGSLERNPFDFDPESFLCAFEQEEAQGSGGKNREDFPRSLVLRLLSRCHSSALDLLSGKLAEFRSFLLSTTSSAGSSPTVLAFLGETIESLRVEARKLAHED